MATAPAGAMCAQHPNSAAVEICERCGNFACGECVRFRDDKTLCRACASRTWFGQYAGFMAIASAILGFLGLGCAPLGAIAVVMGIVEMGLITAGRSQTGGKKLALAGIGLGAVGVGIGVLILMRWLRDPGNLMGEVP